MSKLIEKTWGYEIWFENNEKYCGKVLYVKNKIWSSNEKFHYHKIKDETFYVIDGTLHLDYIENEELKSVFLNAGDSFRIKPGMKHRFTARNIEGCRFIEVSTTHSDDDSYRCYYDLVTQEWVEV